MAIDDSTVYEPNELDMFDMVNYNIELYIVAETIYQENGGKLSTFSSGEYASIIQSDEHSVLIADNTKMARIHIGNISMRTITSFSNVRHSNANTNIDFTLTEPNGGQFVELLATARQHLKSYSSSPHGILKLSFIGRTHEGKSERFPTEWYIPIAISGITGSFNGGMSSYHVTCVGTQNLAETQTTRRLNNGVTITASTLGEMVDKFTKAVNESSARTAAQAMTPFRPDVISVEFGKGCENWKNWEFQIKNSSEGIVVEDSGSAREFVATSGSNIDDVIVSMLECTENFKRIPTGDGSTFLLSSSNARTAEDGSHAKIKLTVKVLSSWKYDKWDPVNNKYSKKIKYKIVPYRLPTSLLNNDELIANKTETKKKRRWQTLTESGLLRKQYQYYFSGLNSDILDFSFTTNNMLFLYSPPPESNVSPGQQTDAPALSQMASGVEPNYVMKSSAPSPTTTKVATSSYIVSGSNADAEISSATASNTARLDENSLIPDYYYGNAINPIKTAVKNTARRKEQNKLIAEDDRVYDQSEISKSAFITPQWRNIYDMPKDNTYQNDVSFGDSLQFGAWKQNLAATGFASITITIRGDVFWLGPPTTLADEDGSISTTPYPVWERGDYLFYLKVNIPSPENENGRKKPHDDYMLSGVYKVTEVNSKFDNGLFTQVITAYQDLSALSPN